MSENTTDRTLHKHIFIGGCQRSGTTMLGAMLGQHSRCISIPESQFKFDLLSTVISSAEKHNGLALLKAIRVNWRFLVWDLGLSSQTENEIDTNWDIARILDYLALQYAEKIEKTNIDILVDHTPNNLRFAATLHLWFPEAKFIHLVRDGRAVAASVIPLDWGPNTVIRAASWWAERVAHGLAAESFFGPEKILRIHYEELVTYPRKTMEKVSDFLGIEFQEQMLQPHGFKVPVYSRSQHALVGSKLDSSRVSSWLSQLSRREIELFERWSFDLLALLGYEQFFGVEARKPNRLERLKLEFDERARQLINRCYRQPRRRRKSLSGQNAL